MCPVRMRYKHNRTPSLILRNKKVILRFYAVNYFPHKFSYFRTFEGPLRHNMLYIYTLKRRLFPEDRVNNLPVSRVVNLVFIDAVRGNL